MIDENTSLMTMLITVRKKSLIPICSPLTLLLCAFFENHCIDTVGHTGLKKTKRNLMEKYYFPNLHTWIKILLADCIKCQTNKIFANNHSKANTEHFASTKTHFMIMIDTKGPINPPSDGQLNLPMKKDAIFKKQRIRKVPIHIRDRIQKLLDVLKKYDIISPVNKEQLPTGNTFTNQ